VIGIMEKWNGGIMDFSKTKIILGPVFHYSNIPLALTLLASPLFSVEVER
jgi:hypothetical protein